MMKTVVGSNDAGYSAKERATIHDLQLVLKKNGIPNGEYSLTGYADERVCLEHTNGKWEVFVGERGQKFDITVHSSLTSACKQVIAELADSSAMEAKICSEFNKGKGGAAQKPFTNRNQVPVAYAFKAASGTFRARAKKKFSPPQKTTKRLRVKQDDL